MLRLPSGCFWVSRVCWQWAELKANGIGGSASGNVNLTTALSKLSRLRICVAMTDVDIHNPGRLLSFAMAIKYLQSPDGSRPFLSMILHIIQHLPS